MPVGKEVQSGMQGQSPLSFGVPSVPVVSPRPIGQSTRGTLSERQISNPHSVPVAQSASGYHGNQFQSVNASYSVVPIAGSAGIPFVAGQAMAGSVGVSPVVQCTPNDSQYPIPILIV